MCTGEESVYVASVGISHGTSQWMIAVRGPTTGVWVWPPLCRQKPGPDAVA